MDNPIEIEVFDVNNVRLRGEFFYFYDGEVLKALINSYDIMSVTALPTSEYSAALAGSTNQKLCDVVQVIGPHGHVVHNFMFDTVGGVRDAFINLVGEEMTKRAG